MMNYKNFQIKQATNDLIEKFIKYVALWASVVGFQALGY